MSSQPPQGTFRPPSPPPPPGGLPPLPWEQRQQIGLVNAFIETVKLFITEPAQAWSRTREKGDFAEPMLFAVAVSWIGIIFSSIYNLFLPAPWLRFLPPGMQGRFGGAMAVGMGSAILRMVLAPVFVVIGLFIGSAIFHLCLMIVGALTQSTSGFEGTFRTTSYAAVATLAQVIPFVGGLISLVWCLVLAVMGATRLHRTTTGKAVFAVLIPVILLCGCMAIAVVMFMGVLAGRIGH